MFEQKNTKQREHNLLCCHISSRDVRHIHVIPPKRENRFFKLFRFPTSALTAGVLLRVGGYHG